MGRSANYKEVTKQLLEKIQAASREDTISVDQSSSESTQISKGKKGKARSDDSAAVTAQSLDTKDKSFYQQLQTLVKTYGEGNVAAFPWPFGRGVTALGKFLAELNNITQTQTWFNEASPELRGLVFDFIRSQQHIQAFFRLVDSFKTNFRFHFSTDEIKNLNDLLTTEETIENLYFKLYHQLGEKLEKIPDIDHLSACNLQYIVTQQDNLHYYRFTTDLIQIAEVERFDELAHALICNTLMQLMPTVYSEPRRQLMSGILDYMGSCPRNSANLTSARDLFFILLKQPHISLKNIFESDPYKETQLAGQQGLVKQVGQTVLGWSKALANHSKAAAGGLSYLAATVGESAFCKLVNRFRLAEEKNVSGEPITQDFLNQVKDILQPLLSAVGFCDQGGNGGMYPISQERFTSEMIVSSFVAQSLRL